MHSNNHDHDHTVLTEPLSCKLCRKRKVRCDKRHPCNNCQKSNLDCVFPQGRQRPTQGRSSRDTELFRRLRHLETALQALRSSGLRADRDEEAKSADSPSSQKSPESQDNNSQTDQDVVDHQVESMAEDFGRLHICNGRSRYTSNALWASLSQEVGVRADFQKRLLTLFRSWICMSYWMKTRQRMKGRPLVSLLQGHRGSGQGMLGCFSTPCPMRATSRHYTRVKLKC